MVEGVALFKLERVHVRAQSNDLVALASPQSAYNTGSGNTALNLDPRGFELMGNELRGPLFFKAELGVAMNVASPKRRLITD